MKTKTEKAPKSKKEKKVKKLAKLDKNGHNESVPETEQEAKSSVSFDLPIEEEEQKMESQIEDQVKGEEEINDLEEEEEVPSFSDMGIDDRIIMAILNLGWLEPTPIQETAIPLILEGRDILAKARTGSGKTGKLYI